MEFVLFLRPIIMKVKVTKHYAMTAYGRLDIQIGLFLTSTLVVGEWSAACR
jgi:hypothetical protein